MKKKENKDFYGEIKIIWNQQEKDEKKQWDEILLNLAKLETDRDKIRYLYNCLADYTGTLDANTLYSSGVVTNYFPNLGELFLDRKINAEINRIKNLRKTEQLIRTTHNFQGYDLDENGNPIFDTIEIEDDDKQKRVCFLYSIGVIDFLKREYQTQSNSTIAGFLTDILKLKKNTISKYLDAIDKSDLLHKFKKEVRDYKRKNKLER